MDNRPIGIFDSGLGGLTAVRALRKFMPEENIIYFGDTGRAPYGVRPVPQLRRMAMQDMDFVARRGAKAILAACGTVSSTAADVLADYKLPVVGVLYPAAAIMESIPGDAPLGVIATDACIKSGAYQSLMAKHSPGREIVAVPCQEFVALVESGHTGRNDPRLCQAVEGYLRPIRERGAAALLLGCTHFGIIEDAIGDFLGPRVQLVGAADCAAKAMEIYLRSQKLEGGEGREEYFTSGDREYFRTSASTFLGRPLSGDVSHVEPMEPSPTETGI